MILYEKTLWRPHQGMLANKHVLYLGGGGGEGVNHVKRDWPEIFNVNCDLYLFFYVKRDRGYLRET